MSKQKLIEKLKKQSPQYKEEQAVQIATFLLSLSEVYYENSTKPNSKNKVA